MRTRYQRHYESVFGLPDQPETKAAWLSVAQEIWQNFIAGVKYISSKIFTISLYIAIWFLTYKFFRYVFSFVPESFVRDKEFNQDAQMGCSATLGIFAMICFVFLKTYLKRRYDHYQRIREVYLAKQLPKG